MATKAELYKKFGETAEATQLLETQLDNLLLILRGCEEELFFKNKVELARNIVSRINKRTLGQLLNQFGSRIESPDKFETLFSNALCERNRLIHSFFQDHNLAINSNEGRDRMIQDLEIIHETLLEAYKVVLAISGIDIEKLINDQILIS
ncbi:MAG: hypothetical protein ACFFDN_34055 [Candidatus Hodarchaeota archaeon]